MPQVKRKKRRGGQPGPRALKFSEIPVVDPSGCRATVYERELCEPVGFSHIERKQICYELMRGERLLLLDKDTFLEPRTGAKYVRIAR